MSINRVLTSGLVTGLAASLLAAVPLASSAKADFTAPAAGAALDLPIGVSVSGMTGDPASRAVADTTLDPDAAFNDFPARGTSYVMLSTGIADRVFEGVPTSQLSTDYGDDAVPDSSSITLTVSSATANAGCLFVDFALGTEEVLGYTANVPDDELSVVKDGVDYAVNAGDGYFAQADGNGNITWPKQTQTNGETPRYQVNQLSYWHKPGDVLDPEPGTAEDPFLPEVTGLNNVTTRDTARVPLDLANGDESVTITVSDAPEAPNGDLDSVAFLDNVRLAASCRNGTGVEPDPAFDDDPLTACCGSIRGIRGVGNALVYDPKASTPEIERYDAAGAGGNGWRSPSGVPVELRFRWYRTTTLNDNNGNMTAWTAIPNADRQSYVPRVIDKGRVLICLVTGVVDGRRVETFPSTSAATSWYVTLPIDDGTFVDGSAPQITGMAKAGEVVSASTVTTTPRNDTVEWQWYAKVPGSNGIGSAISGQNAQTMTIPDGLGGKLLTVRGTAKRASFNDRTFDSAPFGPVELQNWENTPTPQIESDGTPANGETLSVDTGTWVPTPASFTYQWKSDGAVINGATSATYTIRSADVGLPVTVEVSGVKTGYPPVPRVSQPVVPEGLKQDGAQPTITGTPAVDEKLTGGPVARDWVPANARLTYSWYAEQTLIQSGTSRTLRLTPATVNKRIILAITSTKAGFDPLTRYSSPTARVARGKLTAGTVRIYGSTQVGGTLRASTGLWRPSPVVFAYRWKIGKKPVAGPAGRRSTLTLPRSAKGKKVTLVVTGSKGGYATVSRSAVSSTVRP